MRLFLLLPALIWMGLGLEAQTVSPVRREDGRWTQTVTGTMPAGQRLRVSSTGSVSVRGAEGNEVSYSVTRRVRARSAEEAEQLFRGSPFSAGRQGATVVLSLPQLNCSRCNASADLSVSVPYNTMEAILFTQGGSVTVDGISGRLNAETAGGTMSVDKVGGDVRVTTAGGSVKLGTIGGSVRCETAGGSISLGRSGSDAVLTTSGGSISAGSVQGSLRAETAGGSIRAEKVTGEVMAGTSGGSIHLDSVGGRVSAETAGGSIRVASATAGVYAETAGGTIQLQDVAGAIRAANAAGNIQVYFVKGHPLGESMLESTTGNVVVWLPVDVAVTIDATVDFANGPNRIISEFQSVVVHTERDEGFGPRSMRASGAINGGGPVLRIRNTNGRIQIRRRTD
jgi:DUF4097 and DUF4098 domain-containing protein YvlB